LVRYLHTLALFWIAAIAREVEYRANFFAAAITSSLGLLGALFGVSLFYQGGHELGGWSWNEALVVVAIYTMLDGVQTCVLAPNRQQITRYVREGMLDYVLLKPIDSQFWVSTCSFSLWGAPDVLLGLGLLAVAWIRLDPTPAPWVLVLAFLPIGLGAVILYAFGFLLATLTIWFVKIYNITIAMQALLEAGRYPIAAYPAVYRAIFTFVVPVAFMTTVPAKAALGDVSATWLLGMTTAAVLLCAASRAFWKFALRFYTSASS